MGLTHVPVTVSNLITNESFTAEFLIDTGASEPMVPAAELKRIGIQPTGKHVEFRGMTFWRIQDGRIAERWAEIDFASLERQLKE